MITIEGFVFVYFIVLPLYYHGTFLPYHGQILIKLVHLLNLCFSSLNLTPQIKYLIESGFIYFPSLLQCSKNFILKELNEYSELGPNRLCCFFNLQTLFYFAIFFLLILHHGDSECTYLCELVLETNKNQTYHKSGLDH